MRTFTLITATLIFLSSFARAEIVTKDIEYKHGDKVLRGFLAYDDKVQNAPGVVVYPEWWGLNDYIKGRAREVAALGYVAFAADMYGPENVTTDPAKAGEWAGAAKKDNALFRDRATLAIETLRAQPQVDKSRIAATGYCFGGTVALEMARAGADLKGVVSFHGGLDTPEPAEQGQIKASVLVLHGAADPMVPPEQVLEFTREMDAAGADWQLIAYGDAVHAFTNPDADTFNLPPVKYNAKADARSWEAMKDFLAEVLKQK